MPHSSPRPRRVLALLLALSSLAMITSTAPASAQDVGVVVTPPAAPNQPGLTVNRTPTSFTATVEIAAASNLFQFRSRIDGSSWRWVPPSASASYTRSGLAPGESYRIEARAHRNGSWSRWVAAVANPPQAATTTTTTVAPTTTTTDPGTIVVPAVNRLRAGLIMTRSGTTAELEITIEVPAGPYQFRYRAQGQNWFWRPPSSSPTLTLTGLDPASVYEIQGRAYRRGLWSRWVSGELPATSTPPVDSGDPTVPTNGMLVGAQVNLRYGMNQVDSAAFFEEQLGKGLEIVNRYHNLSWDDMTLDRRHIEAGRQLMISWRATDATADGRRAVRIANGEFDTEIRRMAAAVADLESPVMIRFSWDMDQPVGGRQYIGTPAEYVRAWRHVHDLFERVGTTNVSWVWAPRGDAYNKDKVDAFYPGDDYVDWVSASAVPLGSWRSPEAVFEKFHTWATANGKPALVWVGVREEPGNPSYKPDYINHWRELLLGDWSNIKAFVWYHALAPEGFEFWADTTPASFREFKKLVHEVP